MLPPPLEITWELKRSLFRFLWKGTDKVTRVTAINDDVNGGLKMIDLENMIQSIGLAWIKKKKKIFGTNDDTSGAHSLNLYTPLHGKASYLAICNILWINLGVVFSVASL